MYSAQAEESGSSLATFTIVGPVTGTTGNVEAATCTDAPAEKSTAENPPQTVALKVLKIIETYGVSSERDGQSWDGLEHFKPLVTQQIENRKPVRLLLPEFPFKSPNAIDKVLGVLPDLGEELALTHLNGLCRKITETYEQGAEVYICSDGLVYSDLLGVSAETVWNYGEGVRLIAKERGLNHIKFIRLWDLLDHEGPWTREFYLTHLACIRRELLYRYGDKQFEADMASKSDEDMRMTHRSYIKFVGMDLAHNTALKGLKEDERESKIHSIAKSMMGRWRAFASALEENRGSEYVRLSIHDSTGGGKLSMALTPQARGVVGSTPWHSAVIVELDGTYRTGAVSDVDRDQYDLVSVNGRASHFRAKSDLFDWTDASHVTIHHQYPCGIIISPDNTSSDGPASIRTLPMEKIRNLAGRFSPVVLRGFVETTDESLYAENEQEIGDVRTSLAPKGAGIALFTNSRLFFRHLPAPWTPEDVEKKPDLPLVVRHMETGELCLRMHESWTAKENMEHESTFERGDEALLNVIKKVAYDYRVCSRVEFAVGDLLVNDHSYVLHVSKAVPSE